MTEHQSRLVRDHLVAGFPNYLAGHSEAAREIALEETRKLLAALQWRGGRTASAILALRFEKPYFPAWSEIVKAAGVRPEGFPVLQAAIERGVEIVEDLRSPSGYALAGEALHPLEAVAPVAELPPPPDLTDDERAANRARFRAILDGASGEHVP